MAIVIPRVLRRFSKILQQAGFRSYVVGGALRNSLLRLPIEDWDIATDATPGQVRSLYKRVIPTGIQHGTVTVLFDRMTIEVTTFRRESNYSDGRHPDAVVYASSILEDLQRRDLTINALAFDLHTNHLIDPHGGRRDLDRCIVRTVGLPHERFTEDGLRILRSIRIAGQLRFTIESRTRQALHDCAAMLTRVSAERIRDELERIVNSAQCSVGLELLRDCGILPIIAPELAHCVGVAVEGTPGIDLYRHLVHVCERVPVAHPDVRLAALLHDIGKPRARQCAPRGHITYHRHEIYSTEMAQALLRRLRFPNLRIGRICRLIRHHMIRYHPDWSDAAVRRLITRIGFDAIDDLVALQRVDGHSNQAPRSQEDLLGLCERVAQIRRRGEALSISQLAIDGYDLQRLLEIPPGPVVGRLLHVLLEAVLDDPQQNRSETLQRLARNFYATRIAAAERKE